MSYSQAYMLYKCVWSCVIVASVVVSDSPTDHLQSLLSNFLQTIIFLFQEGSIWLPHPLQTSAKRASPLPGPVPRPSRFQPCAAPPGGRTIPSGAQQPELLPLVSARRTAAPCTSKAGCSPVAHRRPQSAPLLRSRRGTSGRLPAGQLREVPRRQGALHQPRALRLRRRQTTWPETEEPHDRCSVKGRSSGSSHLKVWWSWVSHTKNITPNPRVSTFVKHHVSSRLGCHWGEVRFCHINLSDQKPWKQSVSPQAKTHWTSIKDSYVCVHMFAVCQCLYR